MSNLHYDDVTKENIKEHNQFGLKLLIIYKEI